MKITKILILILIFSNQIFANCEISDNSEYLPTSKTLKGIFIVGHGLNLMPDKMKELSNFLGNNGYDVYLLKLVGHDGNTEERKDYLSVWRDQFSEIFCVANEQSLKKELPLNFLGFSLSAAVGLDFMTQQQKAFDKIILIAPAIKTKWYSSLLKVVIQLGINFKIPSKNLKDYRAKSFTYVKEYEAMFSMIDNIESSRADLNSPLVFLHKDDELVNFEESKVFFSDIDSKIVDLSFKKPKVDKSFNHLLIDSKHLGDKAWALLTNKIIQYLDN